MDFIGITSIISLLGAVVGVILVHILVGLRAEVAPNEATPTPPEGSAPGVEEAVRRTEELSAQVAQLQDYLRERDAANERRWQRLERYSEEVKELRAAVRHQRYEVERRLNDSDEARRLRDRELMRHQERELERHRERELEQSSLLR